MQLRCHRLALNVAVSVKASGGVPSGFATPAIAVARGPQEEEELSLVLTFNPNGREK